MCLDDKPTEPKAIPAESSDLFMKDEKFADNVRLQMQKSKDEMLRVTEMELRAQGNRRGINSQSDINVAFIGKTGVGKSSLINAILGAKLCKTDTVECTKEMRSYEHPKKKFIKIWDVPGAGTQNHPAQTYFKDNLLFLMDYLIVVIKRLEQFDIDFIRSAYKFGCNVIVVRSQSDIDINSHLEDTGEKIWSKLDERKRMEVVENRRQALNDNISKELATANLVDVRCYYVSARAITQYRENSVSMELQNKDSEFPQIDEAELLDVVIDTINKTRYPSITRQVVYKVLRAIGMFSVPRFQ